MHRKVKPHPAMFIQNAVVVNKLTAENAETWIENSYIGKGWKLHNKNIITGVPVNEWQIEVPAGVCIDVVPLEEKAYRLKTLTEDVVEASKVSSGNISLEMMNLNLVELVNQTSAEFEEKFEARNLKMIMNLPTEPATIYADGRRMWRVLANVFNNAAKYAMEGSRVYVDLVQTGEEVQLTIKNVSEQPLNISADELTERFIRGDVSRSTEGSGLGLSIAQNLTKLQGGKFELYLDGDLFKVLIRFPVPKETEDVYQEVEQ